MRQVFAHEAELFMAPDGDIQAPGAAVTVGLCGHWDHEPPCPLAPHHTEANRLGGVVHLRTASSLPRKTARMLSDSTSTTR